MVKLARRLRVRDERGASEVFMLMLLTTLLAFAGLTLDAGMLFNARRVATTAATATARGIANDVSTDGLYQGVAEIESFDDQVLHKTLPDSVTFVSAEAEWTPDDRNEVTVTVVLAHEPIILGFLGFDTFEIEGSGIARVQNQDH